MWITGIDFMKVELERKLYTYHVPSWMDEEIEGVEDEFLF